MKNTIKDDGILIWSKDDVYEIEENTINPYYIIKEINGQPYAIGIEELNEYEIVERMD